MMTTKILIVGAGPAGLAIAAHLRKRQLDFVMIEKSGRVGNAWHEHYDRLHLHTVKSLSHLPFKPFPEDYPLYVPKQLVAEYLCEYAAAFDIQPIFHTAVTALHKQGNNWLVETNTDLSIEAEHVILASGVNRIPYHPFFQDEEDFQGSIVHSKFYKNGSSYKGKNVLVIGMGNTGAEIALDLYEHGANSFISVRSPVNIVPRDVMGRPTQLTAQKLSKLPDWLGDWIGVQLRRFTVGDLSKYGIKTPKMPPAKQLRVTGKTPVIDVGTLEQIKKGHIKVLPGIDRFTTEGVLFKNGEELPFDAIILATGYRPGIQDYFEHTDQLLDENEAPRQLIGKGDFENVYFIGYDNYTPGGILGVINRDSAIIAEHISAVLAFAKS
ncbi:MAG: NAD(P)/FAD-dependent oxidoreductase [Saprospiraceae bacterium]|nr:NAD(P)/FAD-dependent oxidoreductase [Saprospiraceae bacterium]